MNLRTNTLEFDDAIAFFDERLSTAGPADLGSDDNFEDSRMSFAAGSIKRIYSIEPDNNPFPAMPSYDMWMAAPGDVKERRKRLFHDMGLASRKNVMASKKDLLASRRNLLKIASSKVPRAVSRKPSLAMVPPVAAAAAATVQKPVTAQAPAATPTPVQASSPAPEPKPKPKPKPEPRAQPEQVSTNKVDSSSSPTGEQTQEDEHSPSTSSPGPEIVFVRSRSDSDIDDFSRQTKQRKEEVFGPESKQSLTRTLSGQLVPTIGVTHYITPIVGSPKKHRHRSSSDHVMAAQVDDGICSFFLIKNLDTGKDFIVREYNEKGLWNKLNDLETGKQLTLEEFEQSVGYSPYVKELMRRRLSTKVSKGPNSVLSKSFRSSKKKGATILKNIKGMLGDQKDQEMSKSGFQWVECHQQGKTHKEFSALHMSQEIQAHQGSIWTIKFNSDGRFLASAGEDKVIHVWEVQECDLLSAMSSTDDKTSDGLMQTPSEVKKKGKENTKKGSSVPDHVKIPEQVLSLSEKPTCTFEGHLDEILDLSWSKNQLLLSSSMDKTVRMWDMETRSCLKMFAHNDYVTCVQFNPVNDDYFFSGSLDSKIRIWNVISRQVADWTDAREMVTAGCYTPDGQGVIVGSLQGNCRIYNITDCQLEHRLDIQKKVQPKKFPALAVQNKNAGQMHTGKITGLQFDPWNQSEVLITSTGSRIGIYAESELVQKFKGFQNTSSQIAASFTPTGKHVLTASEDSRVYLWKVDDFAKNAVTAKKKAVFTVQAYEHFQCKDVSVAIPWPGSIRNEPPVIDTQAKKKRPGVPPPVPKPDDGSDKKNLPPLPKKKNESDKNVGEEESGQAQSASTDPETGSGKDAGGTSSESTSVNDSGAPASTSTSQPASSSSPDPNAVQASVWGLAIVTASLEGEIRVYQNFGLPLKAGRAGYLF